MTETTAPSAPITTRRTSLAQQPWKLTVAADGLAEPELTASQLTTLVEEGIAAKVPGNVHDALLDADFIDDPYIGTKEADQHWVGRQHWTYSSQLPALPRARHHELVAHGLDTVAEILVGNRPLGNTQNMHRTYRFDITDEVNRGETGIEVKFRSPYEYTDAVIEEIGKYPASYEEPYNLIRKMAANYGWDWGPTVVTAGIWRDLVVESWDQARLASVRVGGHLHTDSATGSHQPFVRVNVSANVDSAQNPSGLKLVVTVQGPGINEVVHSEIAATADGKIARFDAEIPVPDVELWWPHTLGQQPLYQVRLSLVDADSGASIDDSEKTVGFREIVAVDEPGTNPETADTEGRFGLVVNGVDTFARGWNWIPNDPLVDRVTSDDYLARLKDVKESGADWVRVWGGGIYEDDAFYDACDQLGILVWQDFAFSCASYPESEETFEEVRAEAVDNVERLMNHPSLGLWCGNNENFMGYESWGWPEILGDRGWGGTFYLETLPEVLAEVDPSRPYRPGSPYSGVPGQMDNDHNYGSSHSWEVWNRQDYRHYLDSKPTFMSEFGWQAPPAWSTFTAGLGVESDVEELDLDGAAVLNHQKAIGGMEKLQRGITEHFGSRAMESTSAWHYLTQVVQARAVFTGIGHWRSLWPRCQGAFVWQINDCWPVISWAGVDVEGRRKPLWYSVRQAFADRLLVVNEIDGAVRAHLVNQGGEQWTTSVWQRVVASNGSSVWESQTPVTVPARSVISIELEGAKQVAEPLRQMLIVDCEGSRQEWTAVPDAEFEYPVSSFSVVLEAPDAETASVAKVRLTADSLMRDSLLQIDRVHRALLASTELRTLLPGEERTWEITVRHDADPAEKDEALAALAQVASSGWSFPIISSVGDILAK